MRNCTAFEVQLQLLLSSLVNIYCVIAMYVFIIAGAGHMLQARFSGLSWAIQYLRCVKSTSLYIHMNFLFHVRTMSSYACFRCRGENLFLCKW